MDYLKLLKDLDISEIDSLHNEKRYVISFKDNAFEANEALYDFISIVQSSRTINEVSKKYSELKGVLYSSEEIENFLEKKFSILFKNGDNNRVFLYKRDVLSSSIIDKISERLMYLYKGNLCPVIIVSNIFLFGFFLYNYSHLITFSLNNLDTYTFFIVIIGLFLSTLFHELGHAAACKYYNVAPNGIGVGVYINMIIFYADVSNIWRLPRKNRIVVNLGGVYFQSLLLLPCYLLFFYNQSYLLGYFIIATNINFLLVLNPFFKFDGYWILSDLLGVPNLHKKSIELIRYYMVKPRARKLLKKPDMFNMAPTARKMSIAYASLSILFLVFFCGYFIPCFIYQYFKDIPVIYNLINANLENGIVPYDTMFYIVPRTIIIIVIGLYVFKFVVKIKRSNFFKKP